MKVYNKYIWKDILKLFPKLIAIILIVALGVGISVGLFTSAPNMRYSIEKYYDQTNAADIIIQGMPFDDEKLEEFKNHPLIEEASAYFSFDKDLEFKNGMYLSKVNIIDFDQKVNKLTLIEGRFPNKNSDDIEIVIERKQPFLVEVPLNYVTTFFDKTVKVVGIVQSPWYFAFVEEISLTEQRPIEIIIYANDELHSTKNYTHISATLKNTVNADMFSDKYETEVKDKIEVLKKDFDGFYFTPRNLNQSFAKYKSDIKIIEVIAVIFPIFFLLVTILVSMSSVTRIVEDQRIQIGTLRSLGYGKFSILSKYIFYSLISSGFGVLLGIGLGVYFIPAAIYYAYKTIYNLPPFAIQFYWLIISIISAVMLLSVTLVTVSYVLSTLNEKTIELLKVKTQKPGKKNLLERITFFWKLLKFKYKSSFRNIFRHKKNLILMLIGISGSTALLITGLGIKDSIDFAGKYQYDEMTRYNLEVTISNDENDFIELEDYESTFVMSANAQYNSKDYITIIVPKDASEINEFIKFGFKKKLVTFDENSVIVTKQFANKHDLKIGDVLPLTINSVDVDLTVTNIQDFYFGNNIYIAKEIIEDSTTIKYNKIYVKTNDLKDVEKEQLKNILMENDKISKTMFEEDMKYSFVNTSYSLNSIVILLVIFSVALAIIINYNLLLININTRKREIATLKVLGYQEAEVSGYVFRETVIISLFAILLGLLIGKGLHYFIISKIIIDGVLLYNDINWLSYILTVLMSMAFLLIVYLMSIPQTKKINMIDALKSFD